MSELPNCIYYDLLIFNKHLLHTSAYGQVFNPSHSNFDTQPMCKIIESTLRGAATTSKLEELEQEREDLLSHVEKYKILEKKRAGDSCKDGVMSCRKCSEGGLILRTSGIWGSTILGAQLIKKLMPVVGEKPAKLWIKPPQISQPLVASSGDAFHHLVLISALYLFVSILRSFYRYLNII